MHATLLNPVRFQSSSRTRRVQANNIFYQQPFPTHHPLICTNLNPHCIHIDTPGSTDNSEQKSADQQISSKKRRISSTTRYPRTSSYINLGNDASIHRAITNWQMRVWAKQKTPCSDSTASEPVFATG